MTVVRETDIILDSISDGVFTVDSTWRITSFNSAAESITGVPREDAIGKPCSYVFRASICESGCALRRTMEKGEPITNLPIYIYRADGKKVPVSISTALLKNPAGEVIGGVETFRDLSVEEELKRELRGTYSFEDMISRNHRMRELFTMIPLVADSPSTVLIQGESGTGKELVARAVHNLSPRGGRPFLAVNCGALPDTLLESELFGYRAGAFTDAKTDRRGLFARAEGGTVLLDEIGDIAPQLQVKLLRLLQEKEYTPLGAEKAENADVRILAATNRDLEQLIGEGTFRTDLYYRLNVVTVSLPPLRERKEDIPLLAEHFIRHFNTLHNKQIEGVSDNALAALMDHDYPGNVRELENAIEHAFVLCRDRLIQPVHLPRTFQPSAAASPGPSGDMTLGDIEKRAIEEALRRHDYNRTRAAEALGIHKTTLHRKLKKYQLTPPRTPKQ